MFRRIRAAAVALAVGAGVLALAPTAATAAADPDVTKVDVSPASADVTAKAVEVTFTVTATDTTRVEFALKAPGDVSVWTPLALSKTGDNTWKGSKTFDLEDVGTWSYRAIPFKGDAAGSHETGTFTVSVSKKLDTKIVDFDARPDRADKGDTLTVTGRLLFDRGGWTGRGGQTVTITFRAKGTDAYRHVTKTTTGKHGWFRAHVKAEETGYWRAEFAETAYANGSVSDTDRVDVGSRPRPSRLSFDAYPEPVTKGDKVNFKGTLQILGRHGWDGHGGLRVAILFKADGSDRWEYVTSATTDGDGDYAARATAVTSGWWRAEFAGVRGVRGTGSDADWVRVVAPAPPPEKMKSWLVKFNAYPEPVKRGKYLHFKGRLLVHDGSWEGYEAKVGLYFRPKGSSKWYFVKTTWSNDNGYLHTKAKAWKSGTWRFYFKGDEDAYGDYSRKDYVRVKR
ncbi:hydroxyisourate hydrolase [Thermoactinospora rubra]|uniref:hydroxyisourate hydrolase n=1 Tax=Thermoactinospora rubra TaxID=1088767 RepID=UPI00117E1854|nr:hydroxyisourate hydrolase [Thermoactinospora rubra]